MHLLLIDERIDCAALFLCSCAQIMNDIEKAKADIAAAEKRQQEVAALLQQAKQGKEDSVSTNRCKPCCTAAMVECR